MINPAPSVSDTRFQVVRFEIRHLRKNLLGVEIGSKKVKDIDHANAHTPNARTSTALLRIKSDAIKQARHANNVSDGYARASETWARHSCSRSFAKARGRYTISAW